MAVLPGDELEALITRIAGGDAAAWTTFVEQFAPLLFAVARTVERDDDHRADAFVYTCQQLRANGAARLTGFDLSRADGFDGWLWSVALNLCRDARRRRVGRFRPFAFLEALTPLEQRVYRLWAEDGMTADQVCASLEPEFPGVTDRDVLTAQHRIGTLLDSRRRFTLLTRRPRFEPLDEGPGAEIGVASDAMGPEWAAIATETRGRLAAALATLSPEDRLLVRLRFEKNVTFARLATMFGLRDVQTVHRRLAGILKRLRGILEARS